MIKVFSNNKPAYINKKYFEQCLAKMTAACNDQVDWPMPISITDFIDYILGNETVLNISFSTGIIRKKCGFYSFDEAKELIKQSFIISERIEKAIDESNNRKDLLNMIEDLAGILSELNSCSRIKVRTLIRRILSKMAFETIVLSDYDYDSLTITFYPEAIIEYCNTRHNIMEVYELEFLERIFNLSHYYSVEDENGRFSDIFMRHDYTSEVVKYSLSADFIDHYCEYYSVDFSTYVYNWRSPVVYSRAGHEYIDDSIHFSHIYEASIYDFDKALRIMFEDSNADYYFDDMTGESGTSMDIFYDIKNTYRYIKCNDKKINQKKLPFDKRVNYFEMFLKSTDLCLSTANDYILKIKRLLKKYYAVDDGNITTLDISILKKLIENLCEIENGNNLSALRKFYDFLLTLSTKNDFNGIKINESKFEEIKQYINKNLCNEFNDKVNKFDYLENQEFSNSNKFMMNFLVYPVEKDSKIGNKPLQFDDEMTFQDYVIQVMTEKGLSNTDVYGGENSVMKKQTLYKILNDPDFIPKKDTIIVICLRLQLSLDESIELLNKAGYTLSTAIIRDLIIRKLLEDQVYNIDYYNKVLVGFGFDVLLGTCSKK